MPSYRPPKIASSEITPRASYLKRREFLAAAAAGMGMAAVGGKAALADALTATKSNYTVDEKLTPIKDVTTDNNFYDKFNTGAVSIPWQTEVVLSTLRSCSFHESL